MTQKKKGLIGLVLMLVLAFATIFGSAPLYNAIDGMGKPSGNYTPGTYVGTARGFGGDVTATVTVDATSIQSVELSGDAETPDIGGAAMEQLASAFVNANSAEVDVISGATYTCNGAMDAVQDALNQAMGIESTETEAQTEAGAETETETATETATETEPVAANGAVSTGVGVSYALKGTDAGDENGTAQISAVVAAVMVDEDGTILQCKIDEVVTNIGFTTEGKLADAGSTTTKRQFGDDYGMKSVSSIGKEWYEQADAFEKYVVGKTAADIEGIAIDEQTKATDADLASGVTVSIGHWQDAVLKAINNAAPVGSSAADSLGLGINTSSYSSKDAVDGEDGVCSANSAFAAVTTDADGKITGAYIEAAEGKVTFDATGKVTSDVNEAVVTKRELHDDYGMKSVSSIGKEWYEQADAIGAYVVGKTADEVAGIAVDEAGKATDTDLLAGCTIAASGFIDVITEAAQNAN